MECRSIVDAVTQASHYIASLAEGEIDALYLIRFDFGINFDLSTSFLKNDATDFVINNGEDGYDLCGSTVFIRIEHSFKTPDPTHIQFPRSSQFNQFINAHGITAVQSSVRDVPGTVLLVMRSNRESLPVKFCQGGIEFECRSVRIDRVI